MGLGEFGVQNAPQVKQKSYEDQLARKIRALSAKRLILSSQQDKVAKLAVQIFHALDGDHHHFERDWCAGD